MKRVAPVLISVIVTVVLVWFLLGKVDATQLVDTLRSLPIGTLLFALLGYVLINGIRALRSWLLIGRGLPFMRVAHITAIHMALVNLLPARTGEISYPYLLKRDGLKVGAGIGAWGLSRIFDLFGIVTLFCVAVILVPLPAALLSYRLPIIALSIAAVVVVAGLLFFRTSVQRLVEWVMTGVHAQKTRFGNWLLAKSREMFDSFHVLKSPQLVLAATACGVAIWLIQFIINYSVFVGIGIPITFAHVVLAAAMSALLSAIPVQGLIGLGTTETFWTLTLVSVGITLDQSIAAGFTQHMVTLFAATLIGLAGTIFHARKPSKRL